MAFNSAKSRYTSIFICILLFSISLRAVSEPVQLDYGHKEFPVIVNLPSLPQKNVVDHPILDNSKIYYFITQGNDNNVGYTITIVELPQKYKTLDSKTIQIMINTTLDTQINTVDSNFGVESSIVIEESSPYQGYPSKYMEVVRKVNNYSLLTYYRSLYVEQYLITIFANTFERSNRRTEAISFMESLEIQLN